MPGNALPGTPLAALAYITIRDVKAGEFLRVAYASGSKGVLTAQGRRDRKDMGYVNK